MRIARGQRENSRLKRPSSDGNAESQGHFSLSKNSADLAILDPRQSIGSDSIDFKHFTHVGIYNETIMASSTYPVSVIAYEAPPRTKASLYPEPFASRMAGRQKQPLGDLFGLTNFGVNLTRLAPQGSSALRHAHTKQDEFIYILQGHPTLHTDEGRTRLSPGMCAGFKAGTGNGHRLINETLEEVIYLEVGDRTPGDEASYPDDDLRALLTDGKWTFLHKDGSSY